MPKRLTYYIGIDLGGTQMKAVGVTPAGKLLAEVTVPTGDAGDGAWAARLRYSVEQIESNLGSRAVGIGVAAPGLPSKTGNAISYMPGRMSGLENLVWGRYLRCRRLVPVLNDAKAALLGETWLGAARAATNVVLLTLGTGVGGAAMVDGHPLRGHLGRAGHLGHISLDPKGALDVTQTPGSLEDAIGDCTIKARSQGRFVSTLALVRASEGGDGEAGRIWLASVQALAAAVSSLINILDPQVVVIGGGIAKAGPALFKPLATFLDRFEWRPGGHKVRIVRAKLGDRAGAFGAAWAAVEKDKRRRSV
jgi:glucokinase